MNDCAGLYNQAKRTGDARKKAKLKEQFVREFLSRCVADGSRVQQTMNKASLTEKLG